MLKTFLRFSYVQQEPHAYCVVVQKIVIFVNSSTVKISVIQLKPLSIDTFRGLSIRCKHSRSPFSKFVFVLQVISESSEETLLLYAFWFSFQKISDWQLFFNGSSGSTASLQHIGTCLKKAGKKSSACDNSNWQSDIRLFKVQSQNGCLEHCLRLSLFLLQPLVSSYRSVYCFCTLKIIDNYHFY